MYIRAMSAACVIFILLAAGLYAQDQPRVVSAAEAKVGPLPGLPACAQGAAQNGDPSKGPSTIYAKVSAGCTVPLHWHTPNEQILMVSGTGKVTAHPGEASTLQRGAYAYMPSKHHHSFTCSTACTFFLISDGAFDIHYVDASGNEIPAEEALKSSKGAKKGKK